MQVSTRRSGQPRTCQPAPESQASNLEQTLPRWKKSPARCARLRVCPPEPHRWLRRPLRRLSATAKTVNSVADTSHQIQTASGRISENHAADRQHPSDQHPGAERGRRGRPRGQWGRGFAVVASEVRSLSHPPCRLRKKFAS